MLCMAKTDNASKGLMGRIFSFTSARRKVLAVIVPLILVATSIIIIHPWETTSNAPLKKSSLGPKLMINVINAP
jgi:hypothetical protein